MNRMASNNGFAKTPAKYAGKAFIGTGNEKETVGGALFWEQPAQDPTFTVLTGYIYVRNEKIRIQAIQHKA